MCICCFVVVVVCGVPIFIFLVFFFGFFFSLPVCAVMPGADGGGGGVGSASGGGAGGGAGASSVSGNAGGGGISCTPQLQQQDSAGCNRGEQVDQVYQVLKQAGEIRTSPRPGGSSSSRQIVGPPAEPRASPQQQQHPQHPNSLGRPGTVATLNVTSPPIASSSGLHGRVCVLRLLTY